LLPSTRQTFDLGVEFGKIGFQNGRGVAAGIDGDEYGLEGVGGFGV